MKAVIFDVDGTLVDSVDFHAEAWQKAFEHFGHTYSFDQIRSQIGKGGDQLMPVFLSEDEVKSQGKQIEEYRGELFQKEYLSRVKPFPQVRALLRKLLDDGFQVALASSAKGKELQTYKKIAEIEDLIENEASSDDAESSKPHPDIFLAAMEKLKKVVPGECVVIGDSPFDAEAASKAGMPAVAFRCGGFPEPILREAGFREIYQDAADLLQCHQQSLLYQRRPVQ